MYDSFAITYENKKSGPQWQWTKKCPRYFSRSICLDVVDNPFPLLLRCNLTNGGEEREGFASAAAAVASDTQPDTVHFIVTPLHNLNFIKNRIRPSKQQTIHAPLCAYIGYVFPVVHLCLACGGCPKGEWDTGCSPFSAGPRQRQCMSSTSILFPPFLSLSSSSSLSSSGHYPGCPSAFLAPFAEMREGKGRRKGRRGRKWPCPRYTSASRRRRFPPRSFRYTFPLYFFEKAFFLPFFSVHSFPG